MADFMVVSVVLSCVFVLCTALLKLNEIRYNKKGLPPGTMGWPIFGETAQFVKQGPSFLSNQRSRFGSFYKTHILGCPTIISMDPELNRNIQMMTESKGMIPGFPRTMRKLLGKRNISCLLGSTHKVMRGTLLSIISPTMIKDLVLPKLDEFMRSYLTTWADQVIDIQQKSKEMALLYTLKLIVDIKSNSTCEYITREFLKLGNATISLPIDFPGTDYHRGLQARKNVVEMLRKIIRERKASGEAETHLADMLGFILKEEENKQQWTEEEEIIDLAIAILYSGFETMSTTSMMAVKYLHDHPHVLHELREEHLAIRARKGADDPIDYEDFKSMRFTKAVTLETLRLGSIVSGSFRKTSKELEINGYVIPKGWRIYLYTKEINYDPNLYPDTYTFNPSRWLQEKSMESHRHFLMFGGGPRICPGKEFGVSEVSMFLHYLVTRYRWDEVGDNKIVNFPRLSAPNGLHMRISSY